MKETELRIGNYVTHDDYSSEVFTVLTIEMESGHYYIHTKGGKNGYWDNNIQLINPIPLTEEWLVKLGFNSKYKSVHNMWNCGGFYIYQKSDVDEDNYSIPQEQVFYYDYLYEIKYVHQLQNLYHDLTGKEL